ncbi:MAG: hypothetical protein QOJ07_2721 [Thermoleophilaceae bacterium]|jgi:hypothetical protein|nr:hypothetical protein [Thermoleophilaceae bacterium]
MAHPTRIDWPRTGAEVEAPRRRREARRRLARRMPLAVALVTCVLLACAAAVNGEIEAAVLAAWVAGVAVLGWRGTRPRRSRRVTLVLGTLTVAGEVEGGGDVLHVVPSRRAVRVLRARPRG